MPVDLQGSSEGFAVSTLQNPQRTYEAYRTDSPERAARASAMHLSPHGLAVTSGKGDFHAVGRFADTVNGVAVCYMTYGSEVVVTRPAHDRYASVLLPVRGAVEITDDHGDVYEASERHSIAVVGPGQRVNMKWTRGCEVITLRLETRAMVSVLHNLAPKTRGRPLHIHANVVPSELVLAVYGVAQLLVNTFEAVGAAEEVPRRVARELAHQTLTTVLLSVDHTHTDEIRRNSAAPGTESVRTAVELVDSETCAIYSVADLARNASVSLRTLELGFRKAFNETPNAYLHRVRIEKAHRELMVASERGDATVGEVASRWGFHHTGRFATRYRYVYGVNPSETLRSN
jgi:AraC-like DNA-binding protein